MNEMTHDRCSELLGPYSRGELNAPEAASVDEHLQGCDQCSEELRGMTALMTGSVEPMTAVERSALHDAIARAARGGRAGVIEILPPRRERNWGRFLAPAVGAAAALVVILFAATLLPDLTGDDEGAAETGAGGDAAEAPAEAFEASGPEPVFGGGVSAFAAPAPESEAGDEVQEGQVTSDSAAVRQGKRVVAPYTQAELRRLGERNPTLRKFARAYDVTAAELASNYLDLLAEQAPDAELADAVRACGTEVIGVADRPVLPAYAEFAPVDGTDSLIIAFVSSGSGEVLDEFMVWVWEDADCAAQDLTVNGAIDV